jgi:ABC-type Fe3+-hydroxamate transport system substrate-binding protein
MKQRPWRLAAFIGTVALVVLTKLAIAGAIALTDTTGRQVDLAATPQRIVALTPSAVETLFAIGAGHGV